ncbi:MAG TPA: hypothetical protein VNL98_06755 [Gemmatimonadales bacterium]|nr:hypothetical protein [Gemmatimonadales bacterium]
MPFVKLDAGLLHSTIWLDRDARDLFVTALLLAVPHELTAPTPQLEVDSLQGTGWTVPPGWYGFVAGAGSGIVHMAGLDQPAGIAALKRLGAPDPQSRTPTHEGRRMVRIDGGYLILNYMKYRDFDYTAAERMRRFRERKKAEHIEEDEATVTANATAPLRNAPQPLRIADSREQIAESREKTTTTPPISPPSTALTRRDTQELPAVSDLAHRSQRAKAIQQELEAGARLVFAYFCAAMGRNGAYLLDEKRLKRLVARLRENGGDVSELFYAVDGAKQDDWIMGRDERARKGGWRNIETIFRDRGQVERFVDTITDRAAIHPTLQQMLEQQQGNA